MKCKLISPGSPHLAEFVVNDVDILKAGCASSVSVEIDKESSEARVSFTCGWPELDIDGMTEPPEEFLKLAKAFGYEKRREIVPERDSGILVSSGQVRWKRT